MLVRSLPLFALVACGTAASTDSSGSGDTGTSLAPDEYADIWDTESAGTKLCSDGMHLTCGKGDATKIFYTNVILKALGLPTV